MEVGLIPPVRELKKFCSNRPFHLLLTHLFKNGMYVRHHIEERQKGSYLVLDNSAHEFGQGQEFHTLLKRALQVDAQEIVLPDQLFEGQGTFDSTRKALRSIIEDSEVRDLWIEKPRQLMFVPQGESLQEFRTCCSRLMDFYFRYKKLHPSFFPFPVTVGISKDYDTLWAKDGGLRHILRKIIFPLITQLAPSEEDVHIHLLGWTRDLWNLRKLHNEFGNRLRSTDSARPFVFALEGISLTQQLTPTYPGRPKNYFDLRLTSGQRKIAYWNSQLFEKAAGL